MSDFQVSQFCFGNTQLLFSSFMPFFCIFHVCETFPYLWTCFGWFLFFILRLNMAITRYIQCLAFMNYSNMFVHDNLGQANKDLRHFQLNFRDLYGIFLTFIVPQDQVQNVCVVLGHLPLKSITNKLKVPWTQPKMPQIPGLELGI